jgi:hypothetical protein
MTRNEKNVVKSRALGKQMERAGAKVVDSLDKASRSGSRSRSAVTGRYVTVSGKVRTVR